MMDKTLCLLQMGFTEEEVSSAIDNFGNCDDSNVVKMYSLCILQLKPVLSSKKVSH